MVLVTILAPDSEVSYFAWFKLYISRIRLCISIQLIVKLFSSSMKFSEFYLDDFSKNFTPPIIHGVMQMWNQATSFFWYRLEISGELSFATWTFINLSNKLFKLCDANYGPARKWIRLIRKLIIKINMDQFTLTIFFFFFFWMKIRNSLRESRTK